MAHITHHFFSSAARAFFPQSMSTGDEAMLSSSESLASQPIASCHSRNLYDIETRLGLAHGVHYSALVSPDAPRAKIDFIHLPKKRLDHFTLLIALG
jgi:hypothetical protein